MRAWKWFAGGVIAAGLAWGCASTKGKDQATQGDVRAPRSSADAQLASAKSVPASQRLMGNIEPVALFDGPMPTGVAASRQGRIFVNYPKWGDDVDYTVAEIKNGRSIPFPSAEINQYQKGLEADTLVSVQSVVVDPSDRLWIVDTGSIKFGPAMENGPKLVGVDLKTNRVIKTIHFPPDVALKTSYLNDVRFDLRRGTGGMAFITDSAQKGPNGIIVVDLGTGRSWRRLHDHPSTKAEHIAPMVEGEPLKMRPPVGPEQPMTMGSDGIAISPDGKTLFYTPLIAHHLYSVSVDALADESKDDSAVAATVQDLGDRGFASDGLGEDAQGRVYLTDYENNAIRRRGTDGSYEIIAQDPRMIWPDTIALGHDGYLYFTANQLNRQAQFHRGRDLRQRPFVLFRTRVDGMPLEAP